MPVVLQPTNSGFNSHLRGGGSENVVIQGRAGVATPVPFLRILYESEVATMSMPHLKSLDVDLQASENSSPNRTSSSSGVLERFKPCISA